MNRTKVQPQNDKNNFSASAYAVMSRSCVDGTHPGYNALAESLKRTVAYLKAQEKINDLVLPYNEHPIDLLSNTFVEPILNPIS